jgi:hypothetical protein
MRGYTHAYRPGQWRINSKQVSEALCVFVVRVNSMLRSGMKNERVLLHGGGEYIPAVLVTLLNI